ncbi:MAG: tRNA preQ1(34) S-adenosylmethionine ribosyltransferase-isomerase QueA [Candidatus Omnitrophica bacterium]|nr:tRNA preQ1(34) S-adenosylmethionine ribosyltransferase-isomerase QueA [Candidatus Omnitrophota bacterium]
MKLSDFDYYLPKELIAQYPAKKRDESRMMVLDRKRKTIRHKSFKEIPAFLKKGDTIVLNNSRVIPARIICKRETGGKAEIFLLKKIKNNLYEALLRPASKLFLGRKLICEEGKVIAEVVENREVGRLIKFADTVNIEKDLNKIGQVPLPPYIKRRPTIEDEEKYQTVYAKNNGSTASPTAGLHFTREILEKIKDRGVEPSFVTLHVSYGTFAPVKRDRVEEHKMHKESYLLPKNTQDSIKKAKKRKRRILAVGTSTTRVLENNAQSMLGEEDDAREIKDSTDLFIYPGYKFRIVDALLTNFHLPKSTLLMLVSAFAERDFILKAYKEAISRGYRFYSYGDCMLIL